MAKETEVNIDSEREQLRWIRMGIERGYDWDLLDGILRANEIDSKTIKELKALYNEETEPREKFKLNWNDRRRLRKLVKQSKKKIRASIVIVDKLEAMARSLNKREEARLDNLRKEMMDAIFGDESKGREGLLEIFQSTDDKGNPIVLTREELDNAKMNEVIEVFEDLVEELGKNI